MRKTAAQYSSSKVNVNDKPESLLYAVGGSGLEQKLPKQSCFLISDDIYQAKRWADTSKVWRCHIVCFHGCVWVNVGTTEGSIFEPIFPLKPQIFSFSAQGFVL